MSNYIYIYALWYLYNLESFSGFPPPTDVINEKMTDALCAFCQNYFLKGMDPTTCQQKLCASTSNHGQQPNVQISDNLVSV